MSTATFYGWKQKFGGMEVSEAQRLKTMEDENRRLKMLVAELSLHGERTACKLLGVEMVRILSVVDAYIRECLALEADTSLGSGRVTRVLGRAIAERGRPENVRSDNGPEFTSRRMLAWSEDWKVGLIHIQPGRPMQNGHVESFHGRLRDECLNVSWFRTRNDVRCTLAAWRQEYNCERPHSSLDYRTPMEFKLALEASRAMARLPSSTTTIKPTENLQL